jgi:hypothetical protein
MGSSGDSLPGTRADLVDTHALALSYAQTAVLADVTAIRQEGS